MSTIKEYFNLERTVRENTNKLNKLASVEDVNDLTEKEKKNKEDIEALDERVETLENQEKGAIVVEDNYTFDATDFTDSGNGYYTATLVCDVLEGATKYEIGPTIPTFQGDQSIATILVNLGYSSANVRRCAELNVQVASVDLRSDSVIEYVGDTSEQNAVVITADELPDEDEILSITVRAFK